MALFVGLDVLLRTTSICLVEANGSAVWEGKAESEPAMLIKALVGWRNEIALVGIEACPLSEWLYARLSKAASKRYALRRGTRSGFFHLDRIKPIAATPAASPI